MVCISFPSESSDATPSSSVIPTSGRGISIVISTLSSFPASLSSESSIFIDAATFGSADKSSIPSSSSNCGNPSRLARSSYSTKSSSPS